MLKKKLFVIVGLGLLFFGNGLQASAAAKGNSDNLKIDAKANEEAIKFVAKHGGLENSPVSAENLTTQQPLETNEQNNNQRAHVGLSRAYTIDSYNSSIPGGEVRCNFLAPAGFTWSDNGIPTFAIIRDTKTFSFIRSRVSDTGIGGYGTGGWYWRKFMTYVPGRGNVYYWLSAWNYDHLMLG